MLPEEDKLIKQEDIIIDDDEIVLPPEPKAIPVRCRESWGNQEGIPDDLCTFMEEMGIPRQDTEFCEFQEYDEESRGVIRGQQYLGFGWVERLTMPRQHARRQTLHHQLP